MPSKFGKSLLIFPTLFLIGVLPVWPDALSGGTPTSWNPNLLYSLPAYVPGAYYWNNASGDGPQANIGWCMVGGAQCGTGNPAGYTAPGYMPFYDGPSGAPSNMFFTSSGNPETVTLQVALTTQKGGVAGIDFLGYYLTDSTGSTISNPSAFFNANNPGGTTFTMPALRVGQNYGFFIENVQGFGTAFQTEYIYYMNSALNVGTGSMPVDNTQHFAIFTDGTTYYIGATDGDACQGNYRPGSSPCEPASQFDFNDMVIQVNSTPEPASTGLFAVGLIVAGALIRRKMVR